MNHTECNVHPIKVDTKDEKDFYANLICTYGDSIYAAAYRITQSPEDAEDVLQNVFLRLLEKKKRLSGEERWDLYLRKMAVNAAIDLVRKRARQREAPLDEKLAESIENMQPSPDAMLVHKELFAQIQSEIAQLPISVLAFETGLKLPDSLFPDKKQFKKMLPPNDRRKLIRQH